MKLANCQITRQVFFVNATKEPYKVADERPHAFDSVNMNFVDAIAIIIARPFTLGVTNRVMGTVNMVIALPFIVIDLASFCCEVLNMRLQRWRVGMRAHPQPYFAALAAHGSHYQRTDIFISAMPSLLIGSASRWVRQVKIGFTFWEGRGTRLW